MTTHSKTKTPAAASAATAPIERLYLVDGSGYIFRAFHALPPLTRADGTHVNAVYGFTQMLMRLIQDMRADHLAVIFDAGRRTFRNDIYAEYKAHRPEPPPELIPQFALVREATRALNVPAIEQPGYEADDLIATYAAEAAKRGAKVTIVSSDKDLMQLIAEGIEMLDPIKNKRIGPEEVKEKFGVGPDKVVDVQALAGDSTDNVPGVPGIGVKTAAQLIIEYGSLETLLERAGEIKQPKRREALQQNREKALMSRRLVELDRKVPVEHDLNEFAVKPPDHATLMAFFQAQEFKRLIQRLEAEHLDGGGAAAVAALGEGTQGEPAPAASGEQKPAERKYELVQDVARLQAWIQRAFAQGVVAVDTETTGLDATQAELVGVSMALGAGDACYIPLQHKQKGAGGLDLGDQGQAPKQIALEQAIKRLKPLLEDPGVLKIGHNIKYDAMVLHRYGIDLSPHDDTMLISFVLEAGLHGHGMDELSELHLGHKTITYEEVTGTGKAQIGFAEVPLERALDYAAEDADVTWRLHQSLKPRLIAEHLLTLYETIERPLVPILAEMEAAGVKVDLDSLRLLSREFGAKMATIEAEAYRLAGREFNVGSPKQLGEILFDELKLTGGKKGKTGAYSTHSDVLEQLADDHPLPAKILEWRQIAKLKSTYADALVEELNPQTGRIHTSFAMAGAATGRLSSTDPNLQNIPVRSEEGRRIRRAFVAEPGHKLLSVDYSQIELRLVAEIAGVDQLKKAFRDNLDIHALTASEVFGVPLAKMDPVTRRKAKAINFGIIYGISAFGLARQIGVEQKEAADYIKKYFERYPGIRQYMEKMRETARQTGYVTTLFGRRCHLRGINDKNPAMRGFAERQAINAPIQGTAADIIKRAMIRVPGRLARQSLKARMLLQVHDELLFEVPDAEVEATSAVVRAVMEGATQPALTLSVPLVADVGVADNWAAAH
ncbi:MAG: DNA polymerase I [Proteobacteria bacterium]|nr:DNA polymerase I [Pseudomonadota bacterium]MBI3498451.1 DNA polymerase I [Pseudomonadota bacterium]